MCSSEYSFLNYYYYYFKFFYFLFFKVVAPAGKVCRPAAAPARNGTTTCDVAEEWYSKCAIFIINF